VYSIERACDPATGSEVAATYLGDIVGCVDKLDGRAERVGGLNAPDAGTVEIEIDAPKAYFLSKLTYPTAFVVDSADNGLGSGGLPNGSGPFRLVEHTPGDKLVLERHPRHHGQLAWLDRVEFDLRPVLSSTLYENGELDVTPVSGIHLARVLDPLNSLSGEAVEGDGDLSVWYLAFDTTRPPFDDARLRRAIHRAIDRDWLASTVLEGAVRPLGTILPPGIPGHDPDRAVPYDRDAARALMAQVPTTTLAAGPLVLTSPGEGGDDSVAIAIADVISESLGVDVTVEQVPWAQFQSGVSNGDFPMWLLGWSADYADPQDFLDVLFHSEAQLNASGYSDARVDGWLEAARVEDDPDARNELYGRAEAAILDASPWVPLYTGRQVWLARPHVRGFTVPPLVTRRLARVWLAEQ
jgi:ABC-type oligopeptide transport system substrate-binding subunit